MCAADANGKTFRTDGKSNSDYFVYGALVVAAGDGVVVVVIDGVPENEPGRMNKDMVPGNLVVIDHRNGEWSHYAHLIPGSATKRIGDVVKSGDVLGKVGNSGNSSEPHLHFHVQDSAELLEGVGIDPQFHDVIVNGRQKKAPHQPVRGERIRAALPPNP